MSDGGTNAAIERPAPRAVFLSYASQDAEAARRICEALQAAHVEVWFDQTDLVGGDAWDAKIRGQIKACALFVPVISANTQARHEGYFRIEWKLAAQRTHAMAEGTPFLLPVVIDETPEPEALVPAEFREVQWTLLRQGPGGPARPEALEKFCARVQAMLGGRRMARASTVTPFVREPAAPRRGRGAGRWLALAAGLAAAGTGIAWWLGGTPRGGDGKGAAKPVPTHASAASVVAEEVARLRRKIVPDQWEKGDYAVVSATLDRLLQAEPENAEAWALRSIVNSLQTIRQFDRGAKPLELGKSAADRALRLAPELPLGGLAHALHLIAMLSRGGDDDAYRSSLDRVLAKLPRDPLTRFTQLLSYYHAYDFPGAERSAQAWLAEEPAAVFPAWILSLSYLAGRRADDAEKWVPLAAGDSSITAIRAFVTQFEVRYYLRADLAGARAALDNVPRNGRTVHRVVHAQWLLAMAEKRWDEALQALQRLPEAMFTDRTYHGPRALLAGLAHRGAGRTEAAATQFREAERILRELLSGDPDNEALHAVLAVTLACAGRPAEARAALGQVEPLVSGRPPSLYRGPLVVTIAQAYREMNDAPALARWLRKLFTEASDVPFTAESLRFDPRFAGAVDAPELQAMLREVAAGAKLGAAAPAPGAGPAGAGAAAPEKSVAVLPFALLGGDKGAEFIADATHDEVIMQLAKVRDLKVISRTSVMAYREAGARNVRRVAEELGVAHVLEGTMQRAGETVKFGARLIDARKDEPIWSATFLENAADIFGLQAKLAEAIATALKATLTPGERALINERPTENMAAYEWYLRARQAENVLNTRSSVSAWEAVAATYEKALALDPAMGLVHARLARIHGTLYWVSHHDPVPARRAKAEAALRAAERNAPDSPETDFTRGGFEYFCNNDWRAALRYYQRALMRLPNDSGLIAQIGYAHRRLGEWALAQAGFERALTLNPADFYVMGQLADHLHMMRRPAEALAVAQRHLRQSPGDSYSYMVMVRAQFALDGDFARFKRGLDDSPPSGADPDRLFPRLLRAMLSGDFGAADELLQRPQPTAVNDLGGIYSEPISLQRARVAHLAGNLDAAQQFASAALRDLGQTALTLRQEAFAQLARAQAKVFLGRFDEAVPELRAAANLARQRDAYTGGVALGELGRALVAMNRRDEALEVLREIMRQPSRLSAHEARLDPFWSKLKDDPRFEEILKTEAPIR